MNRLVLLVCFCAFSHAAEEGNWFTKSLDYFSPEKCSPLEKSDMTGGFFTCVNGAGKDASAKQGQQPQQPQQKQQPSQGGWGSWGTSSYNSGKFNFKDYKSDFGTAKGGQKSSAKESGRDMTEWPLSMNK